MPAACSSDRWEPSEVFCHDKRIFGTTERPPQRRDIAALATAAPPLADSFMDCCGEM